MSYEKNMFETSRDFLNIAIGVAVIGVAAFTSWAIYYFARILGQIFKFVKEMRDRIHKIDELVRTLKEKIEHSTSYLFLIGEGVRKLVEIVKETREKK